MDKLEYAEKSFANIQELIRFIDQKIGAVLVVLGIEITAFLDVSKNLSFTSHLTLPAVTASILGTAFIVIVSIAVWISVINVLRPRLSNSYKAKDYCSYYFDHIARDTPGKLELHLSKITEEEQFSELCSQLYSVSVIMKKKQEACYQVMNYLLSSIVALLLFYMMCKILP